MGKIKCDYQSIKNFTKIGNMWYEHLESKEEYEKYKDRLVKYFGVLNWREIESIEDFWDLMHKVAYDPKEMDSFEGDHSLIRLSEVTWCVKNKLNGNTIDINDLSELLKYECCAFFIIADKSGI